MAALSTEIANEFIERAQAKGRALTQMQLQKLVYIAHAWNLAINNAPLTMDNPLAWDYGPVYRDLWEALRSYGKDEVSRLILYRDYTHGLLAKDPSSPAKARLSSREKEVIDRVFYDYGQFHAYQLSALTHVPGTPWARTYADGAGKNQQIMPDMIKDYFVELAKS